MFAILSETYHTLHWAVIVIWNFYFEKIRVFKAGVTAVNTLAWNNNLGLGFYFVGSRTEVMIDRDSWGC